MKIGHKIVDCIFIGYAHNNNAYRFLMHESENPNIHKSTIMESRNASFFENVFPCKFKNGSSSSKRTYETMNEESHDLEDEQWVQTELRRNKRTKVEKKFGLEFLTYLFENELQNYEAVNSSEGPLWKEAIKSEVDSIL